MAVLRALAAEPATWRYGYELGRQVGLKAGSLYPILIRLADRKLLETRWETPPPGRPARHLYRLTAAGLELATAPAAPAQVSVPRPGTNQPGALRPSPRLPGATRPGAPQPQLDGT
jgi:PadR family transcriptional regulator